MGHGASSVEVAAGLLCGRAARRTAACHNAAREVGVGKHHLHVVGHERAHEAVRVANLVLHLVRLHHRHVSFATIGRCGGRAVLLPPCRGKLRLLLESGLYRLLFLTVRLHTSVVAYRIHLACAFVYTNVSSVLSAQFATNGTYQVAGNNFCHDCNKFFRETLPMKMGVN